MILRLERELRAGTWHPGLPSRHEIRDPKPRTIVAAPFEDRVVHQALCATIGPLLDRGLIAHTYACRAGLGTHAALRTARLWARRYPLFVHLDVRRFFPSVDHAILLAQLARDIPCPRTLALCATILAGGEASAGAARFHFAGDTLFTPFDRHVGLPIGSLTSQHFANRYLSPVDHRAKDRLRVRAYLRYMDDMLLFGDDRAELEDRGSALEAACARQRLRVHPWEVRPTRAGVTWLGFRILPDEVRVRRTSVRRAKARLGDELAAARRDPTLQRDFAASLRSTFAHWQHGTTYRLRTQLLRELEVLSDDGDEHAWVATTTDPK
jgi:hypothetical protein